MGPFETIDLNAPGGVRDYARALPADLRQLFPSTQRRVDWIGPVMDTVEAERARQPRRPTSSPSAQAWRDRRLMALAAHKRRADKDIGK